MIRSLFVTLLASLALAFGQAQNYDIDKAHSVVGFSITHMTVSEVTGTFKDYSGSIAWDDKNLANSKIDVSVQAASVDSREPKRDDHLRTNDFFDVAKFPTVKFVTKTIKAGKDGAFDVTADVTIKGVTKTVSFPLTVTAEVQNPMNKKYVRGVKGAFTLKRTDFDLGAKFPAMILSENIAVSFAAELPRKS